MNTFDNVSAYYESSNSHLHDAYVLVSDIQIAVGVYHRKDNRFLILKSQPILDPEDFKSFVNYELNFPFKSVKVVVCNPFNALFPEPLFDKTKVKELYTFNHTFNHIEEELVTDKISTIGAINVYKISVLLRELLNSYFQSYQMIHYSTAILQGVFSERNDDAEIHLFLNEDFLHIVYKEDKLLRLVNSYDFDVQEDVLYYVLAVYEQLGLNLKTQTLYVHGDCVRFVELFEFLKKYIMEVTLAERPSNLIYDIALDSIPEHLFYPLFAAALCE